MSSHRCECDWGDPFEPWRDVWDASPHAGGGGGGPAQHHTVGSPGEPPGHWVPLLVAHVGWLLTVLDPLHHLPPPSAPATAVARRDRGGGDGARGGGSGGDEVSDDFGDDLGETTLYIWGETRPFDVLNTIDDTTETNSPS
jgi:hypothetical protein